MADPFNDEDEKPLDPAVERVQRRLKRLILISGLTLGIGILAVFLAVVYRLMTYEPRARPPAIIAGSAVSTLKRAELGVPADARLVSTALDGDRMALTYEAAGEATVVIIDLPAMSVVSRLTIRGD